MKKFFYTFTLLVATAGMVAAQSITLAVTTPPCNADGVVMVAISGLTAPVTITYYIPSQPQVVHSGITGGADILNGYAGTSIYAHAVDVNGTVANVSFQGTPPFHDSISVTQGICPVQGSVTAYAWGGAPPYAYTWTSEQTGMVAGTTENVSLAPGGYDLVITDANGCVWGSEYSGDSSISIYSIPPFTYTLATTAASCANGSVTVNNLAGGATPYTYIWSNGANTPGITGLMTGWYDVTITDAQGCSSNNYSYVSQMPQITVNMTATPATCLQNDGAVTAFASGGATPYNYLYDNGATTPTITNLAAGLHTVHVTDANGCIGNGSVNITSTTPITATYNATASACTTPTGTATLAISGGQEPYAISWGTYPAQTGLTATNLAPGNYTFHITDANNCVRNGTVTVAPVDIITAAFTVVPDTCNQNNGSISVEPGGGTLPYTYLWSTGAVDSSAGGLTEGSYSVVITDNAGCSVTKHGYVYNYSPLGVGVTTTPATCIFNANGSAIATAWGGTTPYNYMWSNGQGGPSATGFSHGTYQVYVTDAQGCATHRNVYIGYNAANDSCYCTITGTVYEDLNGNCVQDTGEQGIPNIQMHCTGAGYVYTNASGVYSVRVPTGSFTLSESVLAFYPLASCQNNAVAVSVTAGSNCSQTYDFANVINPIHDIHISTWDCNFPIPGFNYNMVTIVSNEGTLAEPAIQMGYATDGQLNAPVISGILSGGPLWYNAPNFPTLAPAGAQAIYENYSVPANIPLATSIVFKDSVADNAPISNWMSDYSPWNNVNYFTTTTVGAYDPNFMEVSPRGTGANGIITYADSVLDYMVHFQNIGSYAAQTVVVTDTLDADLDWSTLRPVFKSHPCTVTINENGVATFTFSNIQLPPKVSNDAASNGLFTYSIHTKPGLPAGTQFKAHAGIYFDYNEPVVTNTTVNTLGSTTLLNTPLSINKAFTVFPNPAHASFNAVISREADGNAELKVCDITGKVLLGKTLALHKGTQTISVNVDKLAPGIYFINLISNGNISTQKLVIVK